MKKKKGRVANELAALDAMMLNVLKARARKQKKQKEELWDDFDMDDDVLDEEDQGSP